MTRYAGTYEVKLLIYDLIVTEIWKEKLLPIIKPRLLEVAGFKGYLAVGLDDQDLP